jgi:CO/xanthine dehydrogenase FAD-binding subunit
MSADRAAATRLDRGMTGPVALPRTLDEAVGALRDDPDALVIAGGTDLMVDVNAGRVRPTTVVSLAGVDELRGWRREGDEVVVGATTTYRALEQPDFAALVPALAQAARTVGSPQIRNAATIGGNIGTASPAGDTLPVLAALDATVDLVSARGPRTAALLDLVTGVKQTGLLPGELVRSVRLPVLRGPQEFCKVGTRNAMVISVVMVALVVDLDGRSVRVGVGSAAPTPVRARDAEAWVGERVAWGRAALRSSADAATFAEMVAAATSPIDDHRSTAAYRRHAVAVCAKRALLRALGGEAA